MFNLRLIAFPLVLSLAGIKLATAQSSGDIFLRIKKLGVTTTVLYVAAHPDDENTRLITWLSKEKLYRTAYLSLTRGDGGQNLIGSELGVELGLIRTRELMSARKIDGGEQFFTSAYDFGYSKTPEETMRFWNKEKIKEDIIAVIRVLKPDVVITRFPPDSRAGHGHHSASAILAREAFEEVYQSSGSFSSHTPRRIYWNTFRFGSNNTISEQQFHVDAGGYNAINGISNGELAAMSRSQHKSQGFGVASQRGIQKEYFLATAGDTLVRDPFDIPNYWTTAPGGAKFLKALNKVENSFDFNNPSSSIPALINLRKILFDCDTNHHVVKRKISELNKLIIDCSGLWLAAYSNSASYATLDSVHVQLFSIMRNYPEGKINLLLHDLPDSLRSIQLKQQVMENRKLVLNTGAQTSQPYWLNKLPGKGNFNTENAPYPGAPWNHSSLLIYGNLEIQGETIPFEIPVEYKLTDPVRGELIQPLNVCPPLTGSLSESMSVFRNTEKRSYQLTLRYNGNRPDTVLLKMTNPDPENWQITFKDTAIYFQSKNEEQIIRFFIEPKIKNAASVQVIFSYSISGNKSNQLKSFREINYDHIPEINWFPDLTLKLKYIQLESGTKNVLYIKGAGDDIPSILKQIGWNVNEVTSQQITDDDLSKYQCIITGIRAFNTDEHLSSLHGKFMEFVKSGGTFLVQYNTNSGLHPGKVMAPFPFNITRNRVTEEDAVVNVTNQNHPLLNTPNKIESADFENWIQERGLYFAEVSDSSYTDLIKMSDTGEKPVGGSLITCDYGKGRFIYTGLSFFRQIPAGVEGAIRLFVNLSEKR